MAKTIAYSLIVVLMSLLTSCESKGPMQTTPTSNSVEKKQFKDLQDDEYDSADSNADKTVSLLLLKARRADAANKLDSAIATIERALRIQPQNAYLWFYLGTLSYKKGDFEKSIEFAKRSELFAGSNISQRELNADLILRAKHAKADFVK